MLSFNVNLILTQCEFNMNYFINFGKKDKRVKYNI